MYWRDVREGMGGEVVAGGKERRGNGMKRLRSQLVLKCL
jgi:hypothetical protein